MAEAQTYSLDIDERRIVNALEANVTEADTIQGSEVSEQRQRNHINYSLDRLGNERKNRSQHISGDVNDGVESQKGVYREATQSNSKFFKFLPENDQDTSSQIATAYVNDVFYSAKNLGEAFIRDSLHDAMVAKRAVAMIEWTEEQETVVERFSNVFEGQLQQLMQRPGAQLLEVTPQQADTPQGPVTVYSGSVELMKDVSYSSLRLVQPERFFRDPNVAYMRDAVFAGYQMDLARYQLVDMGFDEDEVMNLSLDYRFRQNEEDAARKAHDGSWSRARRFTRNPEQEVVTVYFHWAYLNLKYFTGGESMTDPNIEGTRLYKFVWAKGQLLTLPESGMKYAEARDGYPFIEWTQYKISHAEFGLCEADLLGPIQWSKSNILRLSIDNIAMANTSRWKARQGFIKNPRELLNNNIGSTMWVKSMDALEPLPTPPLSPNTMTVYEQLDQDKEIRTGMSRLSKGMNPDAVRYQNSDDMVERLTIASNRRTMMGVRDFCTDFLAPIALRLYNLGRKHDRSPRMVEIAGNWQEIDPGQFPERSKINIRTALTPDERSDEATFLLQMYQFMSQDPALGMLFGTEEKHAMLDDIFDLQGVGDTSRYMKQPDSPEVQQMMQQQQAQAAEQAQYQQAMIAMQAQLAMNADERENRKVEADLLNTASDNMREDEKERSDNYWKMRAQELDEREFSLKERELALEAKQDRGVRLGDGG